MKAIDKRAIEMAKEALEFCLKNGLNFSIYAQDSGINMFRVSDCKNTKTICYLNFDEREELFKKMMEEAKEL